MNAKGGSPWTDEECAVLVSLKGNYAEMQKCLPHRTLAAIRGQCAKMGLRKSIHVWTAAEISKLRRLFGSAPRAEICAAFPHCTWASIDQVARYRGLRRRARRYADTGIPPLDAVRARCFEIRWSMVDLDKAARTGTYFQHARWFGRKINHRALGRAIVALGGRAQVRWPDYSEAENAPV